MSEPTDADVERLANLMGGHPRSVYRPQHLRNARNALRAGVTLPPEPETPQERFYVDSCESPAGFLVCDRTGGVERGHYASMLTAEWVAYLCNINEKWSGIDNLLEERDRLAARVKELEAELVEERRTAHSALSCWRARAEAAEAKVRAAGVRLDYLTQRGDAWLERAQEAEAKVRLLEEEVAIADRHDHDQMLSHLVDEWGARGVAHKLMEPMTDNQARQWLNVLLRDINQDKVRSDEAQPALCSDCEHVWAIHNEDGCTAGSDFLIEENACPCTEPRLSDEAQPADPMCSGTLHYNGETWSVMGMTFHPGFQRPVPGEVHGVDLYPRGSRPAPRKVTAELPKLTAADAGTIVDTASSKLGGTWSIPPGGYLALAEAATRLLASKAGA
jgi:hypothetical protein